MECPSSIAEGEERYKISEAPLGTTRHLRIVTIGAGASGINMIRTFRENLPNYEHIVYDKNPDVGGTWYENRYPGCRCDVPSHNYQFSWRPNREWSSFFAPAPEIQQYLCQLCDEEYLRPEIKTSHLIVRAEWNERGRWELQVQNLRTGEVFNDHAHFVLDASGILNHWKWPDIPGLHEFRGELIHSADWPESFSHSGKKVAVIGNGSSGVQIVPALQPDVKELIHFIRSPTWIVPPQQQMLAAGAGDAGKVLAGIETDGDKFTPAQIAKFKADPQYYLKFVKAIEEEINSKFPLLVKDSKEAAYALQQLTMYMKASLNNDEALSKALIPTFPVGCRRLTPAIGYLSSLIAKNVRVVSDKIVRIVPQGVELETGQVIEVDALVCATGFDVSFTPRFPIVGRKGNLQDIWRKERPKAYMSCAVPGLPNFFKFLGPNAPIGHGSILTITEHIALYIVKVIRKCQTEGIVSISPSAVATNEYYEFIDAFMPRTAWSGTCSSWFKDNRSTGPVTALHPGSRIHWFHMLENFRGEDFEYVYEEGQRFRYLGNGFSTKELGEGDRSWYLGRCDGNNEGVEG